MMQVYFLNECPKKHWHFRMKNAVVVNEANKTRIKWKNFFCKAWMTGDIFEKFVLNVDKNYFLSTKYDFQDSTNKSTNVIDFLKLFNRNQAISRRLKYIKSKQDIKQMKLHKKFPKAKIFLDGLTWILKFISKNMSNFISPSWHLSKTVK